MHESRFVSASKQYFKKLANFVVTVLCMFLIYMILFGGQYSIASYVKANKANDNARNRNDEQVQVNNLLASENYRIQTDVELQKKLSKELGYMEKGEQIIKRTD